MVTAAKEEELLNAVGRAGGPSNLPGKGKNSSTPSSKGHYSGRNGGGNSNKGHFNGAKDQGQNQKDRYVTPSLSPVLSLVPNGPQVGGRLAFFASAWLKFSKDPWIVGVVSEGFSIDFHSLPLQLCSPPELFVGESQSAVIEAEVHSLLQKNAIEEASVVGFISSIFAIPKKSGGFRPVINLRALNKFVVYEHFKMEGIPTVKNLIQPNDWLVKLDLSDAYLTVPVHSSHKKFLQFRWGGRVFQFRCLPFGLSSAPRVFTKLLKPIMAYLRRQGIRLVIYLDDILIMNSCPAALVKDLLLVRSTLEEVGFLINIAKSVLSPTQQLEYLGLLIDSTTMSLALTESKVTSIISACQKLLSAKEFPIWDISSLLGNFTWATTAVPFAQAHFREIQRLYLKEFKSSGGDLTHKTSLSPEARKDLLWWVQQLKLHSGKSFLSSDPDLVIFSDASLSGWGAACGNIRTGGQWDLSESICHINDLELKASFLALKYFAAAARDCAVLLNLDNTTAVAYINKKGGTKSASLSSLAVEIATWCEQRRISLVALHVPGILNVVADMESRRSHVDNGDWKLDHSLFQKIAERWLPKVDLFALRWNAQLPLFVTWHPQEGAWRTDAFSLNWRFIEGFAFPPFNLIGNCLRKVREDGAHLILVCPYWSSQPWYPLLLEMAVDIPLVLPFNKFLLTSQRGEPHPLIQNNALCLIAWRLSGCAIESNRFRNKLSHLCWPGTDLPHSLSMKQPGTSGVAGAIGMRRIPCVVL